MRILFATDGSGGSRRALDLLADLPLTAADHVTVLSVPPRGELSTITRDLVPDPRALRLASASAREAVAAAGWRFGQLGVPTSEVIDSGTIVDAILARSLREAPQLVVVGSRGRGLWQGAILGSTARALARRSPVPILVVRGRRAAPERVLVVLDDSLESIPAIQLVARLPLPASSELVLLHVRRPDAARGLEHPVEQVRRFIARPHRHRFVDATDIPREIRSEARALGADLVVLGLRGRSEGALPGPSLAERVLAGAQWSVLLATRSVALARVAIACPVLSIQS
jgi:nucleotide-binding universal stress UspA family protein